jgi:hypothetical protein
MHIIFHNDNLACNFLYAYNFSLTTSYANGHNFFSYDELCA